MTLPDQVLTSDAVTIYRTSINGMAAYVPPLLTSVDMVSVRSLLPITGPTPASDIAHASHDTRQAAVLVNLPHRIASATRIRWAYVHDGSTAVTGNYVIGIYNSAGTKIIDTGSVAFTGATSTRQVRSETISATTFEAGSYYVFIGVDTGAGACGVMGWSATSLVGGVSSIATPFVNMAVGKTSGGITAPSSLSGFTDVASNDLAAPKVPLIALSVG